MYKKQALFIGCEYVGQCTNENLFMSLLTFFGKIKIYFDQIKQLPNLHCMGKKKKKETLL